MASDVYKSHEVYWRQGDGTIVETGEHFLAPAMPEVGKEIWLRRICTKVTVVAHDGVKVVVEPVVVPS